ncbi:hypothetical protein EI94DRAFT_1811924 [Lactarius quietus]|nr:hypothetical protein EI94DRAFT_1811924 [Lactarius quietus]
MSAMSLLLLQVFLHFEFSGYSMLCNAFQKAGASCLSRLPSECATLPVLRKQDRACVAALAQVFIITSPFDGPLFNNIQQRVYDNIWNVSASNDPLDPNVASQIQNTYGLERSEELFYIDATNDPFYIFAGQIAADVPSTDDPTTDADWQRWDASSGFNGMANSVYLMETLGGQLNSVDPGSCNPSNPLLQSKFVGGGFNSEF